MADDNTLRVAAEFDVAPLVAGTQAAGVAFETLGHTIDEVAAKFVKEGLNEDSVIAEMEAMGISTKEAQAALEKLAASATEASVGVGLLADEAAASVPEIEAASVATSGLERQMASVTGRAAGATLGMGFLGGAIGRLAGSIPGLGLAFEIALPIALLSAFIPKIEELIHKQEELADAEHSVAEASQKQDDEILKLDEEFTKITSGPMAAYAKELADIPQLSLNVTNETKVLEKELEAEAGWWQILTAKAQDFFLLGLEMPGTIQKFAYSANDAEKAIDAINDKVNQNKDLGAAINGINLEIAKAIQAQNAEMATGRTLDAERTQTAIHALAQEKEYLQAQQQIIADQTRNKRADMAKEATAETLKDMEAEQKLQETVAKTAMISAEAATEKKLIAAQGLPEFSLDEIEAHRKAVDDSLEAERTEKLNEAQAMHDIDVKFATLEMGMYKQGTDEYERALDKKLDADQNYELAKATTNKEFDDKIGENDREAAAKHLSLFEKQLNDEMDTAKRMADLQLSEAKDAQEQITENEKRQADLRAAHEKASLTGLSAGPITEALKDAFNDEQLKAYTEELARLRQEFAATFVVVAPLKAILASGGLLTPEQQAAMLKGEEVLKQIQATMGQIQIKQIELKATMLTSWQDIEKAMQNALQTGVNTFNQQFIKMISTGQSFAKTMINVWNSMAESFINAILKMAEQWITQHVIMALANKIFGDSNDKTTIKAIAENRAIQESAAAAAGAEAMATTPFPEDLVVGPLVFAMASTFREGGLVPGSATAAMPIIAHGGEMVLPSPISTALQGAIPAIHAFNASAPNTSSTGGGGSRVTHNHISIVHSGTNMTHNDIIRAVRIGVRKGELGRELA